MVCRNLHLLALAPLLLALLLTTPTTTAQTEEEEVIHTIWFFGNSYTSYQGLNRRFACFYHSYWARWNGIDGTDVPRNSPGGWALANHLYWLRTDPDAPFFFDGLNYPFVVLQEQSLSPGTEESIEASSALGYFFWLSQVEKVMFMQTWGRRDGVTNCDYPCHQQRITDGYFEMAEAAGDGYIAPCGLVWQKVYEDCVERNVDPLDESVCLFPKLYRNDGSHPSDLGTYACAATIAVAMVGVDPRGWGCYPRYDEGETPPVDVDDGVYLMDVVARVVEETFTSGLITYPFDELWETEAPSPPTSPAPTIAPPPTSPAPTNTQIPQPTNSPTRGTAIVTMTIPPQPSMDSTLGMNATLNSTDFMMMTESPTDIVTTESPTDIMATESPTFVATAVVTAVDKTIWTKSSEDSLSSEKKDNAPITSEEDKIMAEGGDTFLGQGSSGTSWLLAGWFVLLGNIFEAILLR